MKGLQPREVLSLNCTPGEGGVYVTGPASRGWCVYVMERDEWMKQLTIMLKVRDANIPEIPWNRAGSTPMDSNGVKTEGIERSDPAPHDTGGRRPHDEGLLRDLEKKLRVIDDYYDEELTALSQTVYRLTKKVEGMSTGMDHASELAMYKKMDSMKADIECLIMSKIADTERRLANTTSLPHNQQSRHASESESMHANTAKSSIYAVSDAPPHINKMPYHI